MNSTPKPGSAEAIQQGCKCPILDNCHGKGVMYGGQESFWVNADCPLHAMGHPEEDTMKDINDWIIPTSIARADEIITTYAHEGNGDLACLITDILHYCDDREIDFEDILINAHLYRDHEVQNANE